MKIKIKNNDIIWSYLGTGLSMIANIIMIPIIVFYLSGDSLGLWYVFCSIGAMATLFDFGFSTTFARNITYCWSGAKCLEKESISFFYYSDIDWYLFKNVLVACKKIYLYISCIVVLVLSLIATPYIWYISHDRFIGCICYIAWGLYSIAIFLNLYYGYYVAFLRGVGAIALVNKNTVIARLLQIFTTVTLLVAGADIIGASVGYLMYGVSFRCLCKEMFYSYNSIGININKFVASDSKVRELIAIVWHNAWRDGVVSIANYLTDQACVIVCSLFLSLRETGIFSLSIQIATAIGIVASVFYAAQQPVLQAAFVSREKEKLISIMSLIVTVFIISFFLLFAITICIGLPLLELIKPDVKIPFFLFLFASIYQFVLKFRNCYTSYFSCTNRIPYVRSFLLASFLSIIISTILMGYYNYGYYGLIVGQIIGQLFFNAWYWPISVHKELEISFYRLFLNGLNNLYYMFSRNRYTI